MSETLTITIDKVETKTGSKNGKPWKLYIVHDTDGGKHNTFKDAVGRKAEENVNNTVEIDRTRREREGYPDDSLLDAVRPAPAGQQSPAPAAAPPASREPAGPADPSQPGPGASRDVSIVRQVSWKAAAQLFAGTGNFTQALAAAAAIETHILRQSEPGFGEGPADDGIPFDRTAA